MEQFPGVPHIRPSGPDRASIEQYPAAGRLWWFAHFSGYESHEGLIVELITALKTTST
jgi:hypothetical protein